MKKRIVALLLALTLLIGLVSAFAQDEAQDEAQYMAYLLQGDWVNNQNSNYRILFDGTELFYLDAETYYYGIYEYVGGDEFRLINDFGDTMTLRVNDDICLSIDGIEGEFDCGYNYFLVDYPSFDEGLWLHEDGTTSLRFDLNGSFEFDSADGFTYGDYIYLGNSDYLLLDWQDNSYTVSLYEDDSIDISGVDGYFFLQESGTGYDPFESAKTNYGFFDALRKVL